MDEERQMVERRRKDGCRCSAGRRPVKERERCVFVHVQGVMCPSVQPTVTQCHALEQTHYLVHFVTCMFVHIILISLPQVTGKALHFPAPKGSVHTTTATTTAEEEEEEELHFSFDEELAVMGNQKKTFSNSPR